MKKLEKPITTVAIMGRGRGHSHTTNPELEALKMFAELVRYTDYKSRVGEDAIDFSDCPFANKSTVSFFGVCIPINQVGNIMYGYIAKYADFADEAREYGFRGFRALSIKFPGIGAKIHIDIGGPDDSWINSRYKEAGFDWGIKLNEHMTKFWESITPYFENDRTDESMIDRMMTAIIWDNSDKVPGAVWYKSNKDAQKGIIDLPSCGVSYNGKNTDFKRVPGVQIDGNKFK